MNENETYRICPSLLHPTKEKAGYSRKAKRLLFDGEAISDILPYDSFENDDQSIDTFTDNSKKTSLSGVQIKYSLTIDNNVLRLTQEGEQGHYILKPKPSRIRHAAYCAANENLTMQIASQIFKIPTAANGLCFFKNGEMAYFTRRFDIRNGMKLQKEDFASLAGLTNKNGGSEYKYNNLSYQDFALLIDKYSAMPVVDKLRFFTLIVFNYVFCNGDAHLKNFSLLEDEAGKFTLSPAYDLLNTLLHVDDEPFAMRKGLFTNPKPEYFHNGIVVGSTFYTFGKIIGLPDAAVQKALDIFCTIHSQTDILIDNSFLSNELKERYKQTYKTRINSYLIVR